MVKRFIASLLIFVLISNSLFAGSGIDIAKLSLADQQKYIDESLSVEAEYKTNMSTGGFGTPVGNGVSVYNGWGNGKSELHWTPYKGPNEISKLEFFKITNQEGLALEAEKQNKAFHTRQIVGGCMLGVLGVGGLVAFLTAPFVPMGSPDTNLGVLIGGGVASFVGIISGLPLLLVKPKTDVPVSFAINIANGYNRQLFNSLSN